MKRKNLQLMADFIRKIPQELFDMGVVRQGQRETIKCDSVGCPVGHCVELEPNPEEIPRWTRGINFVKWSINFTGLNYAEWEWCFSPLWTETDNTPKGAALRIEWLLKHGLPEGWYRQMKGKTPLCYTTSTN